MKYNKSDLPYLFVSDSPAEQLPNGIWKQVIWEYVLEQSARTYIDNDDFPLLVERVRRSYTYTLDSYLITARLVDEWQYLEKAAESYAGIVRGHRSYWEGEILYNGAPTLQPEVALLLGFSPNPSTVYPFIETQAGDTIAALLEEAKTHFEDDDTLGFHRPAPLAAPDGTPETVINTMRLMRAQVGLIPTKGRDRLIDFMKARTGTMMTPVGWVLTQEELDRRARRR